MNEVEKQIAKRMLSLKEFEFRSLHVGLHDDAYRAADRMLQKLRKAGHITYVKSGRKFIWNLTSSGRQFLNAETAGA